MRTIVLVSFWLALAGVVVRLLCLGSADYPLKITRAAHAWQIALSLAWCAWLAWELWA